MNRVRTKIGRKCCRKPKWRSTPQFIVYGCKSKKAIYKFQTIICNSFINFGSQYMNIFLMV